MESGAAKRSTSMETRVTAIEDSLAKLTEDTSEIVEFVRNGKIGAKAAARSLSWLGRAILWTARIGVAFAAILATITAIRQGKMPEVNFLP